MSTLLAFISPIDLAGSLKSPADDEILDRIHHKYTVMLLILMSVIVSTNQYVGDPIHCWVPGHFTGNHQNYANLACWVSNTYYLPIDDRIPLEGERREWINYYQWLPFILLAQAALFYFPCLVWRGFSSRIGVRLNNIIESARKTHGPEGKVNSLRYVIRLVDRYLGHYEQRDHESCCFLSRFACGKRRGNFLVLLYLACKLLYLANGIGQLFIMDAFLGTDHHFYGFHVISSMLGDGPWSGSSRFPIFTVCDYKVRQMGNNVHRNTLQCVLPINFFNDKLYLGLWFWFIIVVVWTAINLAVWLGRFLVASDGSRYVERHLAAMKRVKSGQTDSCSTFIRRYLRADGILIIRLVQINVSDIMASEITAELYDLYKK